MSVERLDWPGAETWPFANPLLKRRFEIIERGLRLTGGATVAADGRLTLAGHQTYVAADTTAAAIALTLPLARSVLGFRVEGKVVDGANALTLVAAAGDTIDGQPDVETFFRVTLVATATGWAEL